VLRPDSFAGEIEMATKNSPISASTTVAQALPCLCAQAGVPFYLLVDRFTDPLAVSLYGQPGAEGYTAITTVGVGEKLHLPEPFGITLDTSALPFPG
jgi:hypothetical protein